MPERRSADDPDDVAARAIAEAVLDHLAAMGCKPTSLGADAGHPSDGVGASARGELRSVRPCASRCTWRPACPRRPGLRVPTSAAPGPTPPPACCSPSSSWTNWNDELGVRGRLQRLTGAMLRETRMPAVQVEPAFITNEVEAAQLAILLTVIASGGRSRRAYDASSASKAYSDLRPASRRARQDRHRETEQEPQHDGMDRPFAFGGRRGRRSVHGEGYATRRCVLPDVRGPAA